MKPETKQKESASIPQNVRVTNAASEESPDCAFSPITVDELPLKRRLWIYGVGLTVLGYVSLPIAIALSVVALTFERHKEFGE